MVDVDKEKLGRYLSPPKAKLQAKGVASVRSRVVNLKELSPALTIDAMREYMVKAFGDIYALPVRPFIMNDTQIAEVKRLEALYSSWEYLYGGPLAFTFCCEEKFDWGYVQLQLEAKGGVITAAKVYTDSMDWELAPQTEAALTGCMFRLDSMKQALTQRIDVAKDICSMLERQEI